MANFWIGESVKVIVFFAFTFALGKWLVQRGVKVNYTRKIFHFVFFFFPALTVWVFPYEFSIGLTLLSGAVLLACLALMYQPIREKSHFLSTAYSSIDRPEDRPFEVLNQFQFILALLIIPIAMTFAEAFSPHTWDGPFLYLVGGASTVVVLEISRLVTSV